MGAVDIAHQLALLPVIVPVLIVAFTLHELAHALVATALGDPTPRDQGRLTLNPVQHLDRWGSITFLLTFLLLGFGFGWARPVQMDVRNLRRHRFDLALVALAGPLTNFLLALATYAVLLHVTGLPGSAYLVECLAAAITTNLLLAVFNMVPMPPLDGSRVIGALMPRKVYEDWARLDEYAPLFFLAAFFLFSSQFSSLISIGMDHVSTWMAVLAGEGGDPQVRELFGQ